MAFAAPARPLSLRLLGELAGAATGQAGLRQRPPGKAGLGCASQGWAGQGRLVPRRKATLAPLPPEPPREAREKAPGCQGHCAQRPWGAALASRGQPALCSVGGRRSNVKHALAN